MQKDKTANHKFDIIYIKYVNSIFVIQTIKISKINKQVGFEQKLYTFKPLKTNNIIIFLKSFMSLKIVRKTLK